MDILKEIKSKISLVDEDDRPNGIKAVLVHIEVSEKYYSLGLKGSDYCFTDVVYRTNHAFEGILKEAYEILEEQNASRKTPYEIEQYLSESSMLNGRVMTLFSNYRQNWRNPSTHDYQLSFDSHEAFMAIVTVSSFVNILLDQIVEKLSFKSTLRKTASFIESEKKSLEHYFGLAFFKKLIEALKSYSSFYIGNHESLSKYPEAELLGSLSGYVSAFEPSWTLSTNEKVEIGSGRLYIDLVVSDGQEKAIVELKRGRDYCAFYDHINTAGEQVKSYMSVSGIEYGVAYYTPVKIDDEIITTNEVGKENSLIIIHSVPPGTIPTKDEVEEMDSAYDDFH